MKNDQEQRFAYESVLQDLYAKRLHLNHAIDALESMMGQDEHPRGLAIGRTRAFIREAGNGGTRSEAEEAGGALIGAITSVLRQSDHPLGNAEIFRKLKAAGVKFRSKNPQLSVSQVLSRNCRAPGAPVRVGRGKWTMK